MLGAVGPTPLRALKAEDLVRGKPWTPELIEQAGEKAAEEVPAHYRRAGQRRLSEANGGGIDPPGLAGSPETGRQTIGPAERNHHGTV